MNLPLFFAGRYLFAKKSHNVINIISAISAAGMAIGTAALIIILSIYNGFDSLVKEMLGDFDPDILITPAEGKVFVPEGEVYDWLYGHEDVKNISCTLTENIFISYEGRQSMVTAKGVDWVYEEESPVRNHIRSGEFALHRGDVPLCVAGSSLAYRLGINPRFLSPVEMYFPSRTRSLSVSSPMSSVESVNVWPSGIFAINSDIDDKYIIVPIETMKELLEYGDEVSGVEIRLKDGCGSKEVASLAKELSQRLGDGFMVNDRFGQNKSLYKMMRYEKLSIFAILIFIVIIIAFNIFGSLTMLIIEKRGDIQTLKSMGAGDALIRKIFILEGWMISLLGLAAGLVLGIGFSLLQQRFGFIKMPGNFIVEAYPVILSAKDVAVTAVSVAAVGLFIACLPVLGHYGKVRLKEEDSRLNPE
ncbi:MAG: ABC transporter permease [Bacteroidetes bacterium]|uniref:ABC transporter permease n=1 Tax=Candidatus Cryptobacteroides merdigallinarum TaxID=2840770 RepID=A0A9D9HFR8_9BACT|nr:ABC transporter permease [Candidatus Cryptobacteroides merdigallinarum]